MEQKQQGQTRASWRRAARLARCLAVLAWAGAAAGVVPGTARAGEIAYRTYLDLRLPREGQDGTPVPETPREPAEPRAADRSQGLKGPNVAGGLTLEQREKLTEERWELLKQWDSLTPEQLRDALERFRSHVDEARLKNGTAAEQKAIRAQQEERKKLWDRLAGMTEEQRRTYFRKRRAALVKKRLKALPEAERRIYLEREKRREQRLEEFRARWKKMTPEERRQWVKERPMPYGF
jgi:hypothetical protein